MLTQPPGWNDRIDAIKAKASKRLFLKTAMLLSGPASKAPSGIHLYPSSNLACLERRAIQTLTIGHTTYKDACLQSNVKTLCDRRDFLSGNLIQ